MQLLNYKWCWPSFPKLTCQLYIFFGGLSFQIFPAFHVGCLFSYCLLLSVLCIVGYGDFKIISLPWAFSKWLLFPFPCLNYWRVRAEERGCFSNFCSVNLVVFLKVKLMKLWGLPLYWAYRNLTFSLFHTQSTAVHQQLFGVSTSHCLQWLLSW